MPGQPLTVHPSPPAAGGPRHAFTLIEIMIVVAIMAIVMTMSVPIVYKVWHKAPMRKAVSDLVEVCSNARARAIMRGTTTEVVFRSEDMSFSVSGGGGGGGGTSASGAAQTAAPMSGMPTMSGAGLSGRLPENLAIASLKVNGIRYVPRTDVEVHEARVRFFPNGTCDEMKLVFLSEAGEVLGVFTEITTGLASVESDRYKLQAEMK
jgi:prepilin-type N-terminal cleavage/methylation domain-containing protein